MTVTSRIYAQLENNETIYHIANIEYERGDFGKLALIDDAVNIVAASIIDTFEQVDLYRATHGEDPDSDTGT